MRLIKVILSGGGTAGHINPALSIAKKILEEEPDSEIIFVGTPSGMENRLVNGTCTKRASVGKNARLIYYEPSSFFLLIRFKDRGIYGISAKHRSFRML